MSISPPVPFRQRPCAIHQASPVPNRKEGDVAKQLGITHYVPRMEGHASGLVVTKVKPSISGVFPGEEKDFHGECSGHSHIEDQMVLH